MVRVVVVTESRFIGSTDGAVWTREGPARSFFSRYLAAFDQVRVVARVRWSVDGPPSDAYRVDGPGVEVWPVPCYVGPWQYLLRRHAVRRAVLDSAEDGDRVLLRAPSVLGLPLAARRRRRGLPYALEVVGDPLDVFAPGAISHPLRPYLRRRFSRELRRLCGSAAAVAYVTDRHLQERYPAPSTAVTAVYSSVELPDDAYVSRSRPVSCPVPDPLLVSVGSLEREYKGIDVLVEAVAILGRTGIPARLLHVGDGRLRSRYTRMAAGRGLTDRVHFVGALPAGDPVRQRLDRADLFVMPSRTEGLPRALIEAMARALPALGTTVGGIPELLDPADLVRPGDPGALADGIKRMVLDPERMTTASARNLDRSREFRADLLTPRRQVFYRRVAELGPIPALAGDRT